MNHRKGNVMPSTRVLGMILLVGGIMVLEFAHQDSPSFADRTEQLLTLTGNFKDRTSLMIVGGAIVSLLGLLVLVAPDRRHRGLSRRAAITGSTAREPAARG
jgi:hypothetical protein